MKQISLFLALLFVLSACIIYDSLPEPELPIVYVEFTSAVYTSTDTIKLDFQTTFPYEGIYPFYNKSRVFSMSYYLLNGPLIASTALEKPGTKIIDGITIILAPGQTKPDKLFFDTKSPWYFYNRENWNNIILAKAIITTAELTVVP